MNVAQALQYLERMRLLSANDIAMRHKEGKDAKEKDEDGAVLLLSPWHLYHGRKLKYRFLEWRGSALRQDDNDNDVQILHHSLAAAIGSLASEVKQNKNKIQSWKEKIEKKVSNKGSVGVISSFCRSLLLARVCRIDVRHECFLQTGK